MSLILDGTNGLSDVDGSAATPAIRGSDANTGVFFGADQVGIATNGVERVEFGNSETVFNDGGADVDFRVESDTDANALFVQGSDGNVGIGVVPTAVSGFGANKLLEMGGASAPALIFRPSGSTSEHTVLGAGDGLVIGATGAATASNNAIRFFTSNTNSSNTPTERARIDSSGTLLVGRSTTSVSTNGVRVDPDGALFASISAAETSYVYNTAAAAYRFYVNAAGTVFATNTTISAISDQRLKENVQDLDVGLDAVMSLKPRKFDWKDGKGKDIKGDRGWIAQEFEQVFPDMIDEWKDPSPDGEEPYKSVRAELIPVLVKAIQEQQAIITALTARVEALEGAQA
jgi:hypothetical protein